MDEFITPPNHVGFLAKSLFANAGQLIDGSIAYLEQGGGGPETPHTHAHNHLFIVVKGEAKVIFSDQTVIIPENSAYLVEGARPHSVWNNSADTTIMIGMSVK